MSIPKGLNTEFVNSLIESIDQAIIIIDNDGRIILWNQGAVQLYKYSPEEVIGRNIADIIVPLSKLEEAEELMSSMAQGMKWQGTFLVRDKNGREFEAHVIDSPIIEDGEVIGIIGVSHDLTEVIEDRKRRLSSELSSTMEQHLSDLVSDMTHKLNNNLMITKTNLDMILQHSDQIDAQQMRKMIEDASESVDLMAKLTKQMQVLTGKKSFSASMLNLSKLLTELEFLLQLMNMTHISLDLSEVQPAILDRSHMEQILFSLIYYQDQRSNNSPVSSEVVFTTSMATLSSENEFIYSSDKVKSGEYVSLSIMLAIEIVLQIIENFERPFLAGEKHLQLIINSIRGLVDAYHGIVDFDQKTGSLILYFPVANQKINQELEEGLNRTQIHLRANVLIAEDNPILQKSLVLMIENLGLKALAADDGQQAITMLNEINDIELCVLDLKMPHVSGIEVAKHIKQHFPNLPFLLISGYHEDIDEVFNRFETIPHFLAKPFTPEQFEAKITQFIELIG